MDTNSKNNQNQPRSWQELASQASKATPPDDLDILSGVNQRIAAEQWSTTANQPETKQSDWLEELVGLFDRKWAVAGFGLLAVAIVAFGIVAFDVSQDAVIAYELSSWFNPQ